MARVRIDKTAEYKISTMPGLIPALEERIDMARDIAWIIAPIESGAYKESIETSVGYNEKAQVVGRLLATDWKAGWIEFGTVGTLAHATLRRSMEAIGLKITASKGSRARRSTG